MSTYIQSAFDAICKDAKQPEEWYVCLIENRPFYGGPEEGGWWGRDSILTAFQLFPTKELAESSAEKVRVLAQELQQECKKEYGLQCLREMDWLQARGLDADFLLETDGPSEYSVVVSDHIPENRYGNRHYE